MPKGQHYMNIWQGNFPTENTKFLSNKNQKPENEEMTFPQRTACFIARRITNTTCGNFPPKAWPGALLKVDSGAGIGTGAKFQYILLFLN